MLTAEEASARLQAVADEGWRVAAEQRVRKLKRGLRRLAEPFVVEPPLVWDAAEHQQQRQKLWVAATGLDELDDRALRSVMEALHPSLGAALAGWWVAAQGQPYGQSWNRRGFRAPSNPEMTREPRIAALERIVPGAGLYAQPPEWFAAWAPFINVAHPFAPGAFELGPLLAAAIDAGGPSGEATFRTLVDSGNGEHAIGIMGRHVIVGLLRSARPDAWAFIESMLLAAQRQEGLRQSILEAADEGHPEAFTRIIDLTLEQNLIRFAATVRAVAVWLGFPENVEHLDDAQQRLTLLQTFRRDRELAARRALDGDAWDTYGALCAIAQHDVTPALALARQALTLPDRDNRAAAVRFLANSQLSNPLLVPVLCATLGDPDLAVASMAHQALMWRAQGATAVDVYAALDALARRLPERPMSTDAAGIDPEPVPLDRGAVVATMIRVVGDRPLAPLLEFLPSMDPVTRAAFVGIAAERKRLDADVRAAIVKMVGDRSNHVRQKAVEAMSRFVPDAAEARELEPLLTRKAGDLRRGVIGLLSRLPGDEVRESVQRLWGGSDAQRDAACELLGTIERDDDVVTLAQGLIADGPSTTQHEVLAAIVGGDESKADDPTLGLYSPDELTPPRPPRGAPPKRQFADAAAFRIADALDDLAESHRNTPFELVNWQGSTEILLADASWLPSPFQSAPREVEDGGWGMVLPEVFRTWWDERPDDWRGESDALDALRALVACALCSVHESTPNLHPVDQRCRELLDPLVGDGRLQLRHASVVRHVLQWVLVDIADEQVIDECVDATDASLALVPRGWIKQLADLPDDWQGRQRDWRNQLLHLAPWFDLTNLLFVANPFLLTSGQLERWYGLGRWIDQPIDGAPRHPVASSLLYAAHAIGAASDADVYENFIGTGAWGRGRGELIGFTRRRRHQIEQRYPTVIPLADQVRARVIEIERMRGELATAASRVAFEVGSVEGADLTFDLLARLGRSTLVRGYLWNNGGREAVYSRLIQVSHPAASDTAAAVSELVTTYGLSDRRLVDLAMFAPQWASTVEAVLEWEGLESAVWWFHAHTKDEHWSVDAEVRETWAALSAEHTPLTAADLTDGAVDVDWFHRAHDALGSSRWSVLYRAAKYASGGTGHRRAQLWAEAMLGQLTEDDVVTRLRSKRHQDSVRALGLVPLPSDAAEGVALRRYQVLREFERGSKKFGQQRQRSEANAVRIGIENLARTTGAADPQRFVWAMEAAEAGDLAQGAISVVVDDVTVSLSVDVEGMPELAVQRDGKTLKAVPSKLRSRAEIKALGDRRTALKRQASRVRRSLEDAMVRQDHFTDADFAALGRHPVVAPMLGLVVWSDDAGSTFQRRDDRWLDVAGAAGTPDGVVRIAHPVDLLGTGNWIDWQTRLFHDAHRQPFKQVFRELYVLTTTESASSPLSLRWSGHQLQPTQAQGLFTARGWLSDRETGQTAKVFHHADVVARVVFANGWGTPGEVELPTIESVYFSRRGEHLAQPLDSIPPVVFSETMRDLDLVVSVAHAGGVDPEATASTMDMRAALVRETARLMRLDNVTQESSHVVIGGQLGEYSVHLGSGTVHRRPGGALCIIPVDAQRRGRIFLPFADNDPKTAEVVSKVLMLARDTTIKDPTILEQLRS